MRGALGIPLVVLIVILPLTPTPVASQFSSEQTLRVTLLGTGAPPPDRDRMGPSTLVEAGSHRLLFDVGRGASTSIVAHGLNLGAIKTVFFTHLHVDHVVGFPDFWLTGHHRDRFGGRTEPVTAYGPTGLTTMLAGLERAYRDIAADWGLPEMTTRVIPGEFHEPGVVFDEGRVRVTAFRVAHGDIEAYGYRVDYEGHSVVISGDTGFSENLIDHAQGVDLLVHEVFPATRVSGMDPAFLEHLQTIHTTPEAAARVFSATRPKLAVATHAPGSSATQARVNAGYKGRFVVGEDLMTFVIGDSVEVLRRR